VFEGLLDVFEGCLMCLKACLMCLKACLMWLKACLMYLKAVRRLFDVLKVFDCLLTRVFYLLAEISWISTLH